MSFMKIVNVEFNEVVKGMYISEDEKGFLVDIFDLTGLEKCRLGQPFRGSEIANSRIC